MKRFAFRLARLLRVREVQERQARAVLAAALERERSEHGACAARRREVHEAGAQWPAHGSHEAGVLAAIAEGIASRRAALDLAAARLEVARDRLEGERVAYRATARGLKVVRKLRERRLARWLDEARREEQRFLDEAHLQRFGRGRQR